MMRWTLPILAALSACGSPAADDAHAAPSHVENPVAESELTRVRMTPEAVARLGIETGTVEVGEHTARRRVGGEVIVPPGRVLPIAAPVAGMVRMTEALLPGAAVEAGQVLLRLVPLAPVDRDTSARATREVEAARAALAVAEMRLVRTQTLAEGRAGSQRAVEEAIAARDIAQADLDVAQARLRTTRSAPLLSDVAMSVRAPEDGVVRAVSVAAGQSVAAGAALVEVVAVRELWVRAPIYSGDLHRLAPQVDATVQALGSDPSQTPSLARLVAGPPTASATAGTVDRYYALDAASSAFLPGERVMVAIPMRAVGPARTVPYGAILYDANGSEWLYVCEGEGLFRRARVEVLRRAGDLAVLGRRPEAGACVVSVGAAEVFGAEFEPGH